MIKCGNREYSVFIPRYWVEGNELLSNNPLENLFFDEARNKVKDLRRKYVEGLKKLEISVVDEDQIDDGTIYFVPNIFHFGEDTSDGRNKLNAMIKNCAKGKICFPETLTVAEYFANPFYPVCFKNELADKGIDKFLIETDEQVKKLLNYCHDKMIGNDGDRYKELFRNCIFQKYLETPTEYETFLRVLMGSSGEPIDVILAYSDKSADSNVLVGDIEKEILKPESPYFVGCRQLRRFSKLGRIFMPIDYKLSDRNESILMAHGIDPANCEIPLEVLESLRLIMEECNPTLGIMCGFDLMLNKNDGRWYFIEPNMYPEASGVAKKRCISDYDKNVIEKCRLDLELRHEELMRILGLNYSFKDVIGERTPNACVNIPPISKGKPFGTKPGKKKKNKR